MCDYCDCRSQPEIKLLADQHEQILAVAEALRAAHSLPTERVAALLHDLADLLVPHTTREEVGLFAQLRAVVAPEYLARFVDDHRRMDELLAASVHDHCHIGELVDLLDEHTRDEETDMHPAARQLLGPEQWAAVDCAVATLAG